VPASPYRTVQEAMADPQLEHRGALAEVQDKGGRFKVLNPPFRLSAARVQVAGHAADLGEHGCEVLAQAGYTDDEIDGMAAEGVVWLG
jgi:crotonobetainyl-CoA:carnitine CoA-transferase CaiB-like acyl-CoA transferase